MAEEITPVQATEDTVTLEDVYKQFDVSEPAPSAQPSAPATPALKEEVSIPDAFDTDAHKGFLKELATSNANTEKMLREVAGKLSQYEAEKAMAKINEDIGNAVSKVNDTLNLPKKVAEAYLDGKVREDKRLQAIWNNRDKNPKALDAALNVIKRDMEREFTVKVDPSVASAQRAVKEAQRAMSSSTKETTSEDRWASFAKEAGGEDRAWQLLLEGRYPG